MDSVLNILTAFQTTGPPESKYNEIGVDPDFQHPRFYKPASNCDHKASQELHSVAQAALESTERRLALPIDQSSIPFMTATTPPFAIDPILLELERLATAPIPVVSASVVRIFEYCFVLRGTKYID